MLPGVAAMYTFLLNTWNTILERYQQRVNKNTLATVKRQIQKVEDPLTAMMINVEAARIDNAILRDYMPSKAALEDHGIGRADAKIAINNHCMEVELYFSMPGVSGEYNGDREASNERVAIITANRQQWAVTEPDRFELGTSELNKYDSEEADNADANVADNALEAGH